MKIHIVHYSIYTINNSSEVTHCNLCIECGKGLECNVGSHLVSFQHWWFGDENADI